MSELLSKYAVIGTIIGIVLTFILTQIGLSYRIWMDNKKTVRTVLFHLLETYYALDRSNPGRRLSKLIRKVMGMMPGPPIEEAAIAQAEILYTPILRTLLANHMSAEIEGLSKDYQKSVQALAAIDPIKAYYLSRRTSFEQAFQSFASFADLIPAQTQQEAAEIRQGFGVIVNSIKPVIFEDSLRELEADIKSIAWKVGFWTWFRSGKALKRIRTSVEKNIDTDFEQLMKGLMPQIELVLQAMQSMQTAPPATHPFPQANAQAVDASGH